MKLHVNDTVKQKLDELVTSLKKGLEEDLVAVLVHGSAARGGWKAGSDVDLVIVVKDAARTRLESIANALQGARWSARVEAMILVDAEIPRAADVFPVFYDDLRRHHAVLHGNDPFSSLVIEDHHVRLRVEQELREVQIRLRRAVIDALGSPESLRGGVARKIKQVRSPLRALLALKKIDAEDDLRAVLAKCGEIFSIDVAPLARVDEDANAAHDTLVKLLDLAVNDVDAMGAG